MLTEVNELFTGTLKQSDQISNRMIFNDQETLASYWWTLHTRIVSECSMCLPPIVGLPLSNASVVVFFVAMAAVRCGRWIDADPVTAAE